MIYEISNDRGINWAAKGDERILQNVVNLMNTNLYEIPYARTIGVDRSNIDKPSNIALESYATDLMSLIQNREPRAKVVALSNGGFDATGKIIIKAVIEIE